MEGTETYVLPSGENNGEAFYLSNLSVCAVLLETWYLCTEMWEI